MQYDNSQNIFRNDHGNFDILPILFLIALGLGTYLLTTVNIVYLPLTILSAIPTIVVLGFVYCKRPSKASLPSVIKMFAAGFIPGVSNITFVWVHLSQRT